MQRFPENLIHIGNGVQASGRQNTLLFIMKLGRDNLEYWGSPQSRYLMENTELSLFILIIKYMDQ